MTDEYLKLVGLISAQTELINKQTVLLTELTKEVQGIILKMQKEGK